MIWASESFNAAVSWNKWWQMLWVGMKQHPDTLKMVCIQTAAPSASPAYWMVRDDSLFFLCVRIYIFLYFPLPTPFIFHAGRLASCFYHLGAHFLSHSLEDNLKSTNCHHKMGEPDGREEVGLISGIFQFLSDRKRVSDALLASISFGSGLVSVVV